MLLTIGDALGSTAAVIDQATGELVERLTYTTYGMVENDYRSADWENFSEDNKYTGKREDVEVGVIYFGARYYSPYLGRWLSPDPLAIHGLSGDPNPYAFVHGSPMRYVDPNGLTGCDDLGNQCGTATSLTGDEGGGGGGGGVSINLQGIGQAFQNAASAIGKFFSGIPGAFSQSWSQGGQSATPPPPAPSMAHTFTSAYTDAVNGFDAKVVNTTFLLDDFVTHVPNALFGINDANVMLYSNYDLSVPDSGAGQFGAGVAALGMAFIPGVGEETAVAETGGMTTLYRAVSRAELEDIGATGGFSGGAGSMGNKWFAESAQDASAWGKLFFKMDSEPVFTVRVQVPNSVAAQMMRVPRLDAIGPARSAEGAVIDLINSKVPSTPSGRTRYHRRM